MSARRSSNNTDSRRYYEWLDRAQADLQSARLLMAGGGDFNTVVFHCHQVAEKALKGYLLFRTRRHYDGHNITFLVRRAIQLDPDFVPFLEDSPPLNRYYIETRYPTDIPFVLDEDKLRDALQYSVKIYQLIASKLRNEPEAFYTPGV
ncbi:MAG: HEPN domain-containing protein [Eubacteriales bacterium]|jgi:HEPN domain-containing protein